MSVRGRPAAEGGALTISARAEVAASPERVFGYLARLENHWELTDGSVEVITLHHASSSGPAIGGRLRLRGPIGIRRTVRIRVLETQPPNRLEGLAEVGDATAARVTWTLLAHQGGCVVGLSAAVLRTGRLDRILLALSGRRWVRACFRTALGRLAGRVGGEATLRGGDVARDATRPVDPLGAPIA